MKDVAGQGTLLQGPQMLLVEFLLRQDGFGALQFVVAVVAVVMVVAVVAVVAVAARFAVLLPEIFRFFYYCNEGFFIGFGNQVASFAEMNN